MKATKCLLVQMVLPFIFCWFFMTVLVDIIVMPTVFKNISNVQEAGKIGMLVFGRFNYFEIFFGLFILLGVLCSHQKTKLLIGFSVSLLLLSLVYTFYMTPMIALAGVKLHQVTVADPEYLALKNAHSFYHGLYSKLDSAKLLLLLIFAGLITRFNLKEISKECV